MFEANMVGVILVDHESETAISAIREETPEPVDLTRLAHRPVCGYAEFEVVAGSDMRRTGVGVGLTRRLIDRTCAPEVPSLRKVAAITG